MYQIDFQKPIHIHFIGIGGISMSGLAEILLKKGFFVSGSDVKESDLTKCLAAHGAKIYYSQCASNITAELDCIVYTAAIHRDNEEYIAAVKSDLPLFSRAEFLGELMKNFQTPIAVSGTHGKTTTTSMLAHILLAADTDPTISVGGMLKAIGGNIRVGQSDYFLMEACEYTNSFLHFSPKLAIILNIDEDHLDFFKDLADIRHSFHKFAKRLPENGTLVINGHIPYCQEITQGLSCRIVTFGNDPSFDYYADEKHCDESGRIRFTVFTPCGIQKKIHLSVAGEHNVLNALAAIAAGDLLQLPLTAIAEGLADFPGATRRFERKGEINGVTIIDDYAHHPTEIRATLKTAAHCTNGEVWCLFQPHTYTRTKALFNEFTEALQGADHVILADIYAARETDTLGVSSALLTEALQASGADAYYFPTFAEIKQFILEHCQKNDMLITMGAGNVVTIGDELLRG